MCNIKVCHYVKYNSNEKVCNDLKIDKLCDKENELFSTVLVSDYDVWI